MELSRPEFSEAEKESDGELDNAYLQYVKLTQDLKAEGVSTLWTTEEFTTTGSKTFKRDCKELQRADNLLVEHVRVGAHNASTEADFASREQIIIITAL